jgi:amidohydrolase
MNISNEADTLFEELVTIRRDLHRNPELGFEEYNTQKYIVNTLKELNADKIELMADTGVKCVFMANDAAGTIAFRADMDALPITEESKAVYRSCNEGRMHACGHDAHTTILLGVAKLLSSYKGRLRKNIILIFQPAEEIGGAQKVVDENALMNPKVDEIYGLHVWPDIRLGQLGLKAGRVMCSVCDFNIVISGKGAHGAKPHEGNDALVAASQLIMMLQTIISRNIDPNEQAVITVGRLEGGKSRNVICEQVMLEGTIRVFNSSVFECINNRIRKIMDGIQTAYGVKIQYSATECYPPVINSAELTEKTAVLFEASELVKVDPIMGSEDFSCYIQKVPGLYMFLGAGDEKHTEPLHSNKFDFDERALLNGLEVFKRIAGI